MCIRDSSRTARNGPAVLGNGAALFGGINRPRGGRTGRIQQPTPKPYWGAARLTMAVRAVGAFPAHSILGCRRHRLASSFGQRHLSSIFVRFTDGKRMKMKEDLGTVYFNRRVPLVLFGNEDWLRLGVTRWLEKHIDRNIAVFL
mgnify:FL=1